jgi:hypothetical protein
MVNLVVQEDPIPQFLYHKEALFKEEVFKIIPELGQPPVLGSSLLDVLKSLDWTQSCIFMSNSNSFRYLGAQE